jgi:hypothetical protein
LKIFSRPRRAALVGVGPAGLVEDRVFGIVVAGEADGPANDKARRHAEDKVNEHK